MMVWCGGLLSIITDHLHGHELIYQEELLPLSLFTLLPFSTAPHPLRRPCLYWLGSRGELVVTVVIFLNHNQGPLEMMPDGSWKGLMTRWADVWKNAGMQYKDASVSRSVHQFWNIDRAARNNPSFPTVHQWTFTMFALCEVFAVQPLFQSGSPYWTPSPLSFLLETYSLCRFSGLPLTNISRTAEAILSHLYNWIQVIVPASFNTASCIYLRSGEPDQGGRQGRHEAKILNQVKGNSTFRCSKTKGEKIITIITLTCAVLGGY